MSEFELPKPGEAMERITAHVYHSALLAKERDAMDAFLVANGIDKNFVPAVEVFDTANPWTRVIVYAVDDKGQIRLDPEGRFPITIRVNVPGSPWDYMEDDES